MVDALALLLVLQPIGEAAVQGLGLPVPGPLVGLLPLFVGLCVRGGLSEALHEAANALLRHLLLRRSR